MCCGKTCPYPSWQVGRTCLGWQRINHHSRPCSDLQCPCSVQEHAIPGFCVCQRLAEQLPPPCQREQCQRRRCSCSKEVIVVVGGGSVFPIGSRAKARDGVVACADWQPALHLQRAEQG